MNKTNDSSLPLATHGISFCSEKEQVKKKRMSVSLIIMLIITLLLNAFIVINSFAQVPLVYSVENTGSACTAPPLPALSQLPSYAMLPDPFKWANANGRISTFADWECRRNEIKAQIENYEIGTKPPKPSNITATYSAGTLTVKVTENGNTLTITSKIVLPSGTGPFPAIIGMNSGTGSLPASVFSSRNIAQITFSHDQVTTYNNPQNTDPYYKLYPTLNIDNTGQYSAWAWGVSRIIDGLELVKAQLPIDLKHIAVSGCSYAGKMALFAGAFDERIALTIPEESGGGGCASWRFSETMGAVEKLGATSHQWFKESMFTFSGANVTKLPHDHHELMAMVAPRAMLVIANGATDYVWLAEESGYVSERAAEEIYKTLGVPDRFGFSHSGHTHCAFPSNQQAQLEAFVDKFLLGKATNTTGISTNPFPNTDYNKWISAWKGLVLNSATNTAPTVSITSPANNATFASPGSITINANAADADGTVSNVQFYNGTTLLGSDATSPYSFAWTNVAAGTYTITAKATDNANATTTSTAITVVVNTAANTPPTVSITSPVNNASFTATGSITINANAADANGTISNVQFYNGTALLGSDATSPYSFVWSNVAAGTYTLTAVATDNANASTTSAVISVVVNAATGGPDPNVHIYLCFGQSNMEGQGPIETQDMTVDSRFQVMGAVTCSPGTRSFTLGKWAAATPPLFRCDTKLSPADYFGRTMVANLPANIQVRVVPVAVAGCDIALFDKVNYAAYASTAPSWMQTIINQYGGNPYGRLVEAARLAQKDGVIKGILMHQGETNNGQTTWPAKVKAVYDNLINDLGLDPTKTPLLVGEVLTTAEGGSCGGHNAIIATVPAVIPNSYVISASGLPGQSDNLHFTSASYRTLGERYATKMLSLLNPTTNTSPTVSITSPANNATFTALASITINANAADADGTVSSVQFYNGTTLLGSDATSPYSFVWTNVAAGTYTLTAKATDNANASTTSASVTVVVSGPVGQTPYNGAAAIIPGTIQAEEYDLGGQGVAFNDLTAGNSGNATFRGDAVDIETTTDAGGGYNVGWMTNGEWLEYTVNVTAAGTYNMDLRLAANGTGRTLGIEMDGVNISGAVAIPNTGGYQTWQTVRISNINLTAGQKVMRLAVTSDYFNVNYITFSSVVVNVPPVVSITSPANNAGFTAPASITINANATDVDGTISNVQFYNGATLLGSDATSPYSFVWSNVAAGTYTLTAVATDNANETTTSTAITVAVAAPDMPPTVSITSPVNNTTATAPAGITINADAADADGTVSNVQFYNGATLLGSDATSPYSFVWSNVAAGTYTLTAVATDNANASTTSAAVTIVVSNPAGQTPYNGAPANIPGTIQAENYDLGGQGVAFNETTTGNSGNVYRTDAVDIEATSDAGGGYNVGWIASGEWLEYTVNIAATGLYNLEARVASQSTGVTFHVEMDGVNISGPVTVPNTGAWQTFQSVNINNINLTAGQKVMRIAMDANWFNINYMAFTSVNTPPSVSISAPLNNASYTAPASIVITANASDTDGTISNVQFFNGTTLLGSVTASPYSFIWSGVAAGTYTLTAKATDNAGAITTSAGVTVIVNVPSGQSPYGGTAALIPGKIEAENYDLGGQGIGFNETTTGNSGNATFRGDNVDMETTSDAGGGYNVGWIANGEWLEYTVNVTSTGTYNMDLRVAVSGTGRTLRVEMDGVNISGTVTLPNTGGWQTWQTVTIPDISLTAGQKVMRVTWTTDWQNLNYISFTQVSSPAMMAASSSIAPNPSSTDVHLTVLDEVQSFIVVNDMGTAVYTGGSVAAGETVTFGGTLQSGLYILRIQYVNGSVETTRVQIIR